MTYTAADGADFVYRVNDDTEFRTPFAAALTTALRFFKKRNTKKTDIASCTNTSET